MLSEVLIPRENGKHKSVILVEGGKDIGLTSCIRSAKHTRTLDLHLLKRTNTSRTLPNMVPQSQVQQRGFPSTCFYFGIELVHKKKIHGNASKRNS